MPWVGPSGLVYRERAQRRGMKKSSRMEEASDNPEEVLKFSRRWKERPRGKQEGQRRSRSPRSCWVAGIRGLGTRRC